LLKKRPTLVSILLCKRFERVSVPVLIRPLKHAEQDAFATVSRAEGTHRANPAEATYVSVEPFHLFRYLDEQAFRFNERKNTDAGRFLRGIIGVIGKRLEYAKLIGQVGEATMTTGAWQAA